MLLFSPDDRTAKLCGANRIGLPKADDELLSRISSEAKFGAIAVSLRAEGTAVLVTVITSAICSNAVEFDPLSVRVKFGRFFRACGIGVNGLSKVSTMAVDGSINTLSTSTPLLGAMRPWKGEAFPPSGNLGLGKGLVLGGV